MFDINNKPPLYDPAAVQPMRDELTYVGFEELTTPQLVDSSLTNNPDETVLVVINSVCGCAAGSARPGATLALQNKIIPDRITTVFAGQDRDAVDHFRNKHLPGIPPSSPSMALMKAGKPIFFLPRHHIEGRSPEDISFLLKQVFEEHCSKEGPSISKEDYEKLLHAKMCGSKIPKNVT